LKLDLEALGAILAGHDYTKFSRPTLVYENIDKDLPMAFRDSTCQFMVPWIAEYFSRSFFIWDQGNVISEVIERERPDFVIQIMAERFIWNYPSRIALV
jgi:hypothetical protein